jgi:hypothetical protein
MKYLKNKSFQRELRDFGLDDEDIKVVLDDIFKGRAIALGFKMYKIRGAKKGHGKSGGFRNIFFWKKDEIIIFCLLYPKNVQDNIGQGAFKTLKILSEMYENLTEGEIKKQTELKELVEIQYEK